MGDNKNIMLVVRQRDRVVFEGEVRGFSSFNELGNFDILHSHANFISIIKKNYVIHKVDGTKSEVEIDEGIVQAYANKVTVFLGILG
jgi:F0F1-type ATP synthase epsilon subunit